MHISRTLFKKEILTEFVPAKNKSSNKVLIFCSGVPSAPCKDDVLDFWSKQGYWTFFPRYRGCWESRGTFLKTSPEQDVLDVVDSLQDSFIDLWSGNSYRFRPGSITLIGTSFGGPAALLASRDERIHKAIGISPVVDWKAEHKSESLDLLYGFMKTAYGGAYRLNKRSWDKLAKGHFYNPVQHLKELDSKKIMIIHAKDDDIVKYQPVAKFARKLNCTFYLRQKGGHLSSSMLMKKTHQNRFEKFLASS